MISVSTDFIIGAHNHGSSDIVEDVVQAATWIDRNVDIRYYDIKASGNLVSVNLYNSLNQYATAFTDNPTDAIALEQLLLQIKSDRLGN